MLDRRKPYVVKIRDLKTGYSREEEYPTELPSIAIKATLDKEDGKTCLFYWDIGCERGHLLSGKVKKDMPNGIVFHASELQEEFTLTELTMEQFETRIRSHLPQVVSEMLNDLDDVYVWYRQLVGIN